MTKIIVNGMKFEYITAEANIDSLNFNRNHVLGQFVPETILYELATSMDTRLVLFPNYFLQTRKGKYIWDYPYILFWNKSINLIELDNKVVNSTYSDFDFEDSILTRTQRTICKDCQKKYLTLIVDYNDFFVENPSFVKEKFKKFKVFTCPNCRNSLRQDVVKFLESAKPFEGQWNGKIL